ncbi:MAG: tryptophan synthase subunit beta [Candidatus Glassbacteria bacterium]|nr:tryptophan synthase subunit beta [Candidatus Glassbacteria bacterium]
MAQKLDSFSSGGHFGPYGGRYVPEMLIPALEALERCYLEARDDRSFQAEFQNLLKTYSGRPTPLYFADNLSEELGGARIYLKQEGLGQTGSHKINNVLGQALLARRMGKQRLVAETGAGQHGLATATVAAKFGLECEIFMGEVDIARQRPNVFWMQQLGATVTPVTYGTRTLKDAVNESIKNWIENLETTHLLVGSALSAHPYPTIVRDFQCVIGREVREQITEAEGRLPDCLIACVGGGSNSIGLFHPFLADDSVEMVGVEAGGFGIPGGMHSARFQGGRLGIIEGYKSYFLTDEDGQTLTTHSVAAGLDYAGIGPEHALLHDRGRVTYTSATDEETVEALKTLMRTEGIIPALESAHAVAEVLRRAPTMERDKIIVVNLSGRGDKDIFIVAEALRDREWLDFLARKVEEGFPGDE